MLASPLLPGIVNPTYPTYVMRPDSFCNASIRFLFLYTYEQLFICIS